MRGVLGLGLSIGLLTALWSLASGGSVVLAFVAYSLAGTCASLVSGLLLVMLFEEAELAQLAD